MIFLNVAVFSFGAFYFVSKEKNTKTVRQTDRQTDRPHSYIRQDVEKVFTKLTKINGEFA